ncbi:MAG: LamG-like jellyroll fold domain-containing protein [Chthoniobacteraceae bacterium]
MKLHLFASFLAVLLAGTSFGYGDTNKDSHAVGWPQYRDQLLKDKSLVRYYTFEQPGNEVQNLAGNKQGPFILSTPEPYYHPDLHPGLDVDFPQWTEGRFAGKPALEFGSAFSSACRSMFYGTSSGLLTLESWVRIHDPSEKKGTMLFSVGTGFGEGWFLQATHFNTYLQIGRTAEEKGNVRLSVQPLTPHLWHHVVAQIDTHSLRLYVDGVLAGATEFEGTFKQPTAPGGGFAQNPEEARGGLKIGPIRLPENTLRFDCDELGLYDRVLTAEEVRDHFEQGQSPEPVADQVQAHLALLEKRKQVAQITIEIPRDLFGYFPAGKTLPLTVAVPAAQGSHAPLMVDVSIRVGKNKPLFKEQKAMVLPGKDGARLVWDLPLPGVCGLYEMDIAVKDATGTVLAAKSYPIATTAPVPPMSQRLSSSPLAGHNIFDTNNDLIAIGAISERIIPWRPKTKEGEFNWKYTDQEVDLARSLGLDVLYCESPRFDLGQVDISQVTTDPKEWEAWMRPVVERYKGRVKYWEILNEPNSKQMKPDVYVALLKTAHRVIREIDPEAKIVGLCGVTSYPEWTESVLAAGGGGYFDILAFHNYIGSSPISAWQRDRKIERTQEVLRKYLGKEVPLWNTESGIHQPLRKDNVSLTDEELFKKYASRSRRENGITLVSADAVTMATEHVGACWQTQSILLDCALGVERYYLLMGPSNFYLSAKGSGSCPTEKGIAYAAMASVLSPMTSIRLLPISSTSAVGVNITAKDGRNTAALFADVPTTRCFVVKNNTLYRGMDFLGNPLTWEARDHLLTVSFGMEPVYIFDVPADFSEAPFLNVKSFPALVSPSTQADGVLSVANLFSTPLNGRLEITSPKSTVSAVRDISLAPGQRQDVPFRLQAGPLPHGKHPLIARLFAQDKEIASNERIFASEGVAEGVPMLTHDIKLDGDPSDWEDVPAETADTAVNVVMGKPPVGYYDPNAWQGSKDLSFSVKTAWRPNDGVYLFITVTDDVIKTVPPDRVQRAFLQDALELFFDGRALKDQAPVYSFGAEQTVVVPAVKDALEPCLLKSLARYGDSIDVEFVGKRTPSGYVMEGRVRPMANSPFKLVPGARFGMDLVFDDAGEAEMSRRTQMALHGTANNSTDTSCFGRYRLLGGSAVATPNLLRNIDLKGENETITGWKFSSELTNAPANSVGEVKCGVKEIDGKRALWISPTTETQSHSFWTQTFPATEETAYCASFRLKGVKEGAAKWYGGSGDVIFLGKSGEFLGSQALGSIGSTASGEWGTFNAKFLTPAATTSVGFRFGVLACGVKGTADFYCADMAVRKQ